MLQPVLLTMPMGRPAAQTDLSTGGASGYGTIVSGFVFHSSYMRSASPGAISLNGA